MVIHHLRGSWDDAPSNTDLSHQVLWVSKLREDDTVFVGRVTVTGWV